MQALRRDWRTAVLEPRDRALLAYVDQVTRHAWRCSPQDLDELRGHGFDDRAILQINLIASFFNYVNRVADGLGVGRCGASLPEAAE